MSRSATKLALAVSVPMITLATLSVLGSHPKHASVPGSAAQAVRYLAPGHTAPNVRHLAQVAPTPIPVAAAPVAATGQLAFVQLMRLWGIPYTTAGENIAWSTNPSMAGINTMFMNSPEHRANILKAGYHRVGIGVASNGAKVMVVEVFSN